MLGATSKSPTFTTYSYVERHLASPRISGPSISPPESRATKFAKWWGSLSPWGKGKPCGFFSLKQVPSVSPNFPCPNNKHTLKSAYAGSQQLHASKVDLTKDDFYQVGQSPTIESCGAVIDYALEAGKGIVQIVSDKTNEHPHSRHTIAGMLLGMLNAPDIRSRGDGVLLKTEGHSRYILMSIAEAKQDKGNPNKGYRQFVIKVRERNHGGDLVEYTIPLTQIGMPFKNLVLKADDIRHASNTIEASHNNLMDVSRHKNNSNRQRQDSFPQDQGPLLLSKHGHGRNATVATYMAVKKLIKAGGVINEDGIYNAITTAVENGRAARPYFVHSLEQVKELQIALEADLKDYKNNLPPLSPFAIYAFDRLRDASSAFAMRKQAQESGIAGAASSTSRPLDLY